MATARIVRGALFDETHVKLTKSIDFSRTLRAFHAEHGIAGRRRRRRSSIVCLLACVSIHCLRPDGAPFVDVEHTLHIGQSSMADVEVAAHYDAGNTFAHNRVLYTDSNGFHVRRERKR